MERFRVLSDLHMDINEKYPFSIDDSEVFTVVAGDTSGHPCIISAKCAKPNVYIDVKNTLKAAEFFKGAKRPTVKYDAESREWRWKGKALPKDAIEIGRRKAWGLGCSGGDGADDGKYALEDGERIVFHVKSAEDWLRSNVKHGILIAGNHLVYNRNGLSIEEQKRRLHAAFPADSELTFLDNSVGVMSKEVDGILFVGSTLYTDYRLPVVGCEGMSEERTVQYNMGRATPRMSGGGLNDFNFGKTEECTYSKAWGLEADSDLSYITPENYLRFFNRTMDELKRIVESPVNKDKPIVVVTHHCPSAKCIDDAYVDSPLNASYVSDLEEFIISHKNIKCWVCGHVHHRASFRIGECLVVMNPLGYCSHGEYLSSRDGLSHEWTPDTFVNVKTWELETKPSEITAKWRKRYEREQSMRMKWYKRYGGLFIC